MLMTFDVIIPKCHAQILFYTQVHKEYYMALSVSHPISTRDSLGEWYWSRVDMGCDTERAISYIYANFLYLVLSIW